MADERRRGILLTQQIIYGDIASPLWVDFADKSANIDLWGNPVFWLTGIPYLHAATPLLAAGSVTDTSPIEMVHWAALGHAHASGIEYWRQCLDLFMRLK